ncbi:hypothetical protein BDN70DRAFT_885332 [Pholiota conissans]|uniref:Fe2OG dioxygenase domain-containing protein n=1 Tax=Pholiota conissans TaxID=109636 RepID=A0A9P5YRB9_9AGAR|nr:hypothetical protein BDN70DRAFT_885332 [Pholiota conissans]
MGQRRAYSELNMSDRVDYYNGISYEPVLSLDGGPPELKALQAVCKQMIDVPYCSGTVQLNPSNSLVFYRKGNVSSFIDFAHPTEKRLMALAGACSPASFGRNSENILDEKYRRAGQLETKDFSAQFSLHDSGVLKTAVESLLKVEGSVANVRAELYKLNVYGPGSFFKAHVDTPRSDTMFASLVVVLPTPHSGGSLLFRHRNTEYIFDSAAAVSSSSPKTPYAAFAAFFSDVEHEVTEVTSGHRVSLTYNLYNTAPVDTKVANISPTSTGVTTWDDSQKVNALKEALTSLLRVPTFLPDGGLLAFSLAYDYPFKQNSTQLSDIKRHLKSTDTLLVRACDELGLAASLKALYWTANVEEFSDVFCFLDDFGDTDINELEEGFFNNLCDRNKGAIVGYDTLAPQQDIGRYASDERKPGTRPNSDYFPDGTEILPVVWATALDSKNAFQKVYIAYGNEAELDFAYGRVCLVIRVCPAVDRI